jgi:hypothetical protein
MVFSNLWSFTTVLMPVISVTGRLPCAFLSQTVLAVPNNTFLFTVLNKQDWEAQYVTGYTKRTV